MKRITITMVLMLIGYLLPAQIKVGDNPSSINSNAAFEIESTSKGLLLPRMTLAQMNAINLPAQGLMVYVTDNNCAYVYNGTKWKSTCSANVNAVISSGTLSCTGTLNGDYVSTVDMTDANTKVIAFTLSSGGDYICYTDTVNGVYFRSEGTISASGATSILLKAYGNPNASGTFTYTVKVNGYNCTFNITFANPPANILNGAVDCSGSLAGNYKIGNDMVPANNYKTITVTPTSVGYYDYKTNSVNGVYFEATGVFNSGQLNSAQTLNLIAKTTQGATVKAGTYTYEVSGTNVSTTCTFNVTFTEVQYLFASTTTTQSITGSGDITWSTLKNLGVSCNGTQITLKAGKTYEILARPAFNNANFAQFNIVNSSNVVLSGSTTGFYANNSHTSSINNGDYATAIYTVGTSDEIIKIRITSVNSGPVNVRSTYSSLTIREVKPTSTYALGGKSSTQTISSAGTDVSFTQITNNLVSISGTGITLKAGKTYMLKCQLRFNTVSDNPGSVKFAFVNQSNATLSGTQQGTFTSVNSNFGSYTGANKLAGGVYTVGSSDEVVKVRVTNILTGQTYEIKANWSFVSVIEIPSGNYYAAALAPVSSNTLNVNSDISWGSYTVSGVTGSGNTITLKAGRTYWIRSELKTQLGSGAGTFFIYGIFNSTNSSYLSGTTYGYSNDLQDNNGWNNGEVAGGIFTVGTSDVAIKLRINTYNGTNASTFNNEAYLIVEEL